MNILVVVCHVDVVVVCHVDVVVVRHVADIVFSDGKVNSYLHVGNVVYTV